MEYLEAGKEAFIHDIKTLFQVTDEDISQHMRPTEAHATKFRENGITQELDVHGVSEMIAKKLQAKLATMGAEEIPDGVIAWAEEIAEQYTRDGGIDYRVNKIPTEVQYAQLHALISTPQFLRSAKAGDVLAALVTQDVSIPVSFEAYVSHDHTIGGYQLLPEIDASYIPSLERLIADDRLWQPATLHQSGTPFGAKSEMRRIFFSNVADILVLLAKQSSELDQSTARARLMLAGRNARREGHAECGAKLGRSIFESEHAKAMIETMNFANPDCLLDYDEAVKIMDGEYMHVAT